MATSWTHAESSARRFGGKPESYLGVHQWFDNTKECWADGRHRAIKHHSHGIWWCEEVFGPVLRVPLDDGTVKEVPTRLVAEQHVSEDMGGRIPTVQDWLERLPVQPWMNPTVRRTTVTL